MKTHFFNPTFIIGKVLTGMKVNQLQNNKSSSHSHWTDKIVSDQVIVLQCTEDLDNKLMHSTPIMINRIPNKA